MDLGIKRPGWVRGPIWNAPPKATRIAVPSLLFSSVTAKWSENPLAVFFSWVAELTSIEAFPHSMCKAAVHRKSKCDGSRVLPCMLRRRHRSDLVKWAPGYCVDCPNRSQVLMPQACEVGLLQRQGRLGRFAPQHCDAMARTREVSAKGRRAHGMRAAERLASRRDGMHCDAVEDRLP